MTELLKKSQREYLRHLVLDTQLQRFSTQESLDYIYSKLRTRISESYLFRVKRQIIESAGNQLEYLSQSRNAYFASYFERINETYKLQRETYKIYNSTEDDNCKLRCLLQLKELTVLLTDLYNLLPNITGIQFSSAAEGVTAPEEHGDNKHINGYNKNCKVCLEAERPSYEEDPEFQV
jgi:hypothetical protein